MASIIACDFTPQDRPAAGTGSFTLTVDAEIRNGALLNAVDVEWNVGTLYDGTLHYDPAFSQTIRIGPNSIEQDTWQRTFGNHGGVFFPDNREVDIHAFIQNEQSAGAESTYRGAVRPRR